MVFPTRPSKCPIPAKERCSTRRAATVGRSSVCSPSSSPRCLPPPVTTCLRCSRAPNEKDRVRNRWSEGNDDRGRPSGGDWRCVGVSDTLACMKRSGRVVLLCGLLVGCDVPGDEGEEDDTGSQVSGFAASGTGSTTGSGESSSANSTSGTRGSMGDIVAEPDDELEDTGSDTSSAATSSRDATTGTSGDSSKIGRASC